MIKSFKRLWNDRRGNALIIAGASLPLMLGSVGLATDTVQWVTWKRELQRAADSAALAGALSRVQGGSSSAAVTQDINRTDHGWRPGQARTTPTLLNAPQVTDLANTPNYQNGVQVVLRVQKRLSFSSMFMSAAPIITATSQAAAVHDGNFCVVALENTPGNSGIIIQGNANVNMGCGMISNSPSASVSVGVNGNSHWVTADPVAGAGGVPDINGVTNEESYHIPEPDPYANKWNTDIPTGMTCGNMSSHFDSTHSTPGTTYLNPGCYSGNNQFKFTGGDYVLNPGVYYLDSIDFVASGGTISGNGVTIVLTGNNPGQLNLNGNATIQLVAPTADPFGGVLMIQSPNASNSNNTNTINGGANSNFDGIIYIPKQQVTFSGSSGAITKCAMVVARRVEFAGSTNLQNNVSGCHNNTQVAGWKVRLIG